jgi:hypothetical protein
MPGMALIADVSCFVVESFMPGMSGMALSSAADGLGEGAGLGLVVRLGRVFCAAALVLAFVVFGEAFDGFAVVVDGIGIFMPGMPGM